MRRDRKLRLTYLFCMIIICSLFIVIFGTSVVYAATREHENQNLSQVAPDLSNAAPIVSNEACLECHGKPELSLTLSNGDILDLYVNPDNYEASIHGKDGYACVQCHTDLGNYPHPAFPASDLRDVTLQLTKVCDRCHSGEYNRTMDSVHAAAQAAGMREAAVCTDCHGSHYVRQLTDPGTNLLLPNARLDIPITCSRCHFAIYQKYRSSVHGAALTEESNTDVPTCIDCHGVHNIENPTTNAFLLNSPLLCASCHTDPELMDKYGISTNVLNTYVADFHGTTVTLFEKQSPDSQTNKPVCYDCHGVHAISRVTDPKSGIEMQQNLLVRCKACHPDATTNFPGAWMSHYIPSPEHYSMVYYVNLFYKFFIPVVLGGMVALVGLDVGHSVYVKTRRGKRPPKPPPQAETTSPPESPMPFPPSESLSPSVSEAPSKPPPSEILSPPPTEVPIQPPPSVEDSAEEPHE